jgi:hypothetical protein
VMDWTGTYRFAVCLMLTEILAAVLILDVVRDGSYLRRLLSMRAVVAATLSRYLLELPMLRMKDRVSSRVEVSPVAGK